jgi:hypothetical protein
VIYHTVTIQAQGFGDKKKWIAGIQRSQVDRVGSKTVPMPIGFYNYPATMSDKKAFSLLKGVIVKRHKDEIKNLQRSLDKLKTLKL